MNTLQPATPFAEVIESSLSTWRAQCWDWDTMPTHGSLLTVTSGSRTLFGLVHAITTGSHDNQRTVFAYKKSEEQLKKEHPHIFEFLTSTFTCITLGYREGSAIQYQIAPTPPKIHAFVTVPTADDLRSFFSQEQYLHLLFAHADQLFSLDDLLLALVEQLAMSQTLTPASFKRFVETFSLLTANDYRRLKLFLQRAQPILQRQDSLCSAL